MSDLLTKYLLHADPIHRGWTPAGIANAVTATCGRSFPRVGGGYNLYRGTDRSNISEPCGAAPRGTSAITPWSWLGLAAATWYFRLAAIGAGGVEAFSPADDPRAVRVEVTSEGPQLPFPPAPRSLRAAPLAEGRLRVAWEYQSSSKLAAAAAFAVYWDAGTGTVDLDDPLLVVSARGVRAEGPYAVDVAGPGHGMTVKFVVRSRTSLGAEEENMVTATAVTDALGPAAVSIAGVVVGADE